MKTKKLPNLYLSIFPILLLIISILLGIRLLDCSPHIPMLLTTIVTILIGIFLLDYRWEELENGIRESINSTMSSIIILMIVGIVIGTWILSGVVPSMIYYGLKLINPTFFLPCVLIVCSIVSLSIGSSWTTVATIGVAFVGIGISMGFSLSITAGAIISGAYFGDKMSPLSDTTNLAPAVAGTTLYAHIKHMCYTTGVTYIICLLIFSIMSLKMGSGETSLENIENMATNISNHFYISPILLFIPCLVIAMAILKIPPLLGLIGGSVLAGIFAMAWQGASVADVVDCMHYGYVSETGIADLDELLTRGGLDSMMWTVSLIIIAMMYAGVMEKLQMIESITSALAGCIQSRGSLILTTALTSIGINFATGEQYLSIVIPGRMYKDEYLKRNLDPKNLSRVVEDCGTITSPLIPWNGCGAFMQATLGLTPWVYVPYCLFNIINPIVSIAFGYLNISMAPLQQTEAVFVADPYEDVS